MREHVRGRINIYFIVKKLACFLLICATVLFSVSLCGTTSEASEVTFSKEEKTRAIAIVFDNSGTMYMSNNQAWSRAIYAMEVFTAMANDGDTVTIYPMNPITVNGKTYSRDGSEGEGPLTLAGGNSSDVEKVRNIYSIDPTDTPIEVIENAFDGLSSENADEKWLIVITDGDYFYKDGVEKTVAETEELLSDELSDCAKEVNVMYLGMPSETSGSSKKTDPASPVITGETYKSYVEIVEDSSDVPQALTKMCNMIYGRNALGDDHLYTGADSSGDSDVYSYTLQFDDLSMSKLLVFVQGSEISGLKVKDAEGNVVYSDSSGNSYNPKYPSSENSNGHYATTKTDETLSGEIGIIDETLSPGTYTLEYSSSQEAGDVNVYYEPNVRLSAHLISEDGTDVLDSDENELYPGTYTLEYGLADEYGNLTDSSLLGDQKFIVSKDGETINESSESGSVSVEITEEDVGSSLDLAVDAYYLIPDDPENADNYLNGYHLSTKDSQDLQGLSSLTVSPSPFDFESLSVEIEADSGYNADRMEEAAPITVNVLKDGQPLSEDEMRDQVELADISDGDLDWTEYAEKDAENSCFVIDAAKVAGDLGYHEMTAQIEYSPESGEPAGVSSDPAGIDIIQLKAEIEAEEYYQTSKLSETDPIYINITINDEPLTYEEMENAELVCLGSEDVDWTAYAVPDYANSRFEVILTEDNNDTGSYELTAQVKYREIETESDLKKIEIRGYPRWLPWVIIAAVIAIIVAIIVWRRNQKVLPKGIEISDTKFLVDGEQVTGKAKMIGYEGGKKYAEMTITSPKSQNDLLAKCSITLTLEAEDKRKTKSSDRTARVRKADLYPLYGIESYKIGSVQCSKNPETGKFDPHGSKAKSSDGSDKEQPLNIRLTSNQKIIIDGEMPDGDNMEVPISLSVTLKYK